MFLILRFFFITFTFFFISACHEKNYNILEEAKNFLVKDDNFQNSRKEDELETKRNNKNQFEKKEKKITKVEKQKINNKKSEKTSKELEEKKTSRVLEDLKRQTVKKNINSKKYKENADKINSNFDKKIKVGIMLPLTGDHSEVGNLILNAIEMAIFQTEENKLELHVKDTEAKPEKTKKAFSELTAKGVNIFVGPLFSKSLAAIHGKIIDENVSIFALTNNINLRKKGIWIFGVDPQAQTEKILQYALEKGSKNIAALLPQNAYGLLLYDTISNFAEENLMKIEKIKFFEFSINNQRETAQKLSAGFDKYQQYLDKLKEHKNEETQVDIDPFVEKPFDSVFIAASGQNLTVLSSQLQYNNVDPKTVQFLGISSWEDNSILSEPALEGGVFVTTSQIYQEKIKVIYKNSFNKEMPKIAMIAYDIVALLGSLDNLEYDINHLVNDQGYIGLRGLFRLKNTGTVERTFQLKKIKNKKFITLKKARKQFSGL